MVFVFYLLYVASQVGTDIWLSIWSEDPLITGPDGRQQTNYRLGVYAAFGVGQSKLEYHSCSDQS